MGIGDLGTLLFLHLAPPHNVIFENGNITQFFAQFLFSYYTNSILRFSWLKSNTFIYCYSLVSNWSIIDIVVTLVSDVQYNDWTGLDFVLFSFKNGCQNKKKNGCRLSPLRSQYHGLCLYSFSFLRFYLFLHERHRER